MNKHLFAAILAICAGLFWSGFAGAASFHFLNGHIISMRSAEATADELIVVDGKITAIGKDLQSPDNATTIDMQGGYLMPGLAEMHAHVPHPSAGKSYRDDVLFLWVSAGITTARGMLGHPTHLALKQALLDQTVLGPRLITSGPSFNGRTVTSPKRAREMVEQQVAAGYDFLKIHPGITADGYAALSEKAKELGIPFAGHIPADVGLHQALAKGQLTIDHIDGYVQALIPDLEATDPGYDSFFGAALVDRANPDLIPDLIQESLSADVWIVPTETLFENFAHAGQPSKLLDRQEIKYLPTPLKDQYIRSLNQAEDSVAVMKRYLSLRKTLIRKMHQSGVNLLLGSDSPQIFNVPGFAIQRELTAMVAAGLSPFDALKTGTVNAAKFLALKDHTGYLEPGSIADMVLLARNPLSDIANVSSVRGVMVRGRWVDAAEREQRLADIAARYADNQE